MNCWSMKTGFGPGNYRRNDGSGKLLNYEFRALLLGLTGQLIDLSSGYNPQLNIVYKVRHQLDLHHEPPNHPRPHSTIPIATARCRDPAVSFLGAC